jgi:PAS domain S-box-containing protein
MSADELTARQAEFLAASGDLGLQVFDEIHDIFFFVKDLELKFVYFNRAFSTLLGLRADEILGRRDEDLSPEYLAEHYREDDRKVIETGARLVDTIELVHDVDGAYEWFTTTKFPVVSNGTIIGVAGVTRSLTKRSRAAERLVPFEPAIRLISEQYDRQLSVGELAESVSMSPTHFTRLFKAHFGTSPHRYLRRVRLAAACDLLSTTDLAVGEIAIRTGYYDHSHLTNELTRAKGLTPTDYRQRYRRRQRRRQVVLR